MPCDRTCSCLNCPELQSHVERGDRQEIALYFCPIAVGRSEKEAAASE